jgi:hypothetical protein
LSFGGCDILRRPLDRPSPADAEPELGGIGWGIDHVRFWPRRLEARQMEKLIARRRETAQAKVLLSACFGLLGSNRRSFSHAQKHGYNGLNHRTANV